MRKLPVVACASALTLMLTLPALAIKITNQDGETRSITITNQDGARSELDIDAGQTVTICQEGCFITFPDGTLTAYKGSEEIVIRNGGPALAK